MLGRMYDGIEYRGWRTIVEPGYAGVPVNNDEVSPTQILPTCDLEHRAGQNLPN